MIITCMRRIKSFYFLFLAPNEQYLLRLITDEIFKLCSYILSFLDDVWGSTSFGLNNRVRVTQLSEPVAFYRLFIIWCQLYQFFSSTSHHACESELCQTVLINYSGSTSQETS